MQYQQQQQNHLVDLGEMPMQQKFGAETAIPPTSESINITRHVLPDINKQPGLIICRETGAMSSIESHSLVFERSHILISVE